MRCCRFCKEPLNQGFYGDAEPIHTRCLALEAMDLATHAQLSGRRRRPKAKTTALTDAELAAITLNPSEAA